MKKLKLFFLFAPKSIITILKGPPTGSFVLKALFLIFSLNLSLSVTYAQDIRVGLKVFPEGTFRITGWENGTGYKYSFGYPSGGGGVFVQRGNFEYGVNYAQQTVVQNTTTVVNTYDVRYTARFIQIPISYRKEFSNFYLSAGVSSNFRLTISKTIENQVGPGTVSFSGGTSSKDEPVALGLHFAGGYTFPLSDKMNLFVEGRLGGIIHKFGTATYGIGFGVSKEF
jgi:hypothetical protein